MTFKENFVGIIKSIGAFYLSMFGIDKFAQSEDGQALENSVNDITKQVWGKPVFQTKKEKEAVEKKAKEIERQATLEIAKNTRKIAEMFEKL